ncbi:uncharacterized protein CCOS01_08420 [Colletotrichum costaricense]|uniref:Uncharacterized protein n=1 Tax=Colletotrichum costaricense TaxID=1209916 RepID=A0AAJ0E0R1_9PEZI|nr:uncharacterized protein CCOS01_08420 [Colletotrichum costaricense]KAK1526002.1 hypothetical protein CCOS01_08420 [Colletotrichum costaricense]
MLLLDRLPFTCRAITFVTYLLLGSKVTPLPCSNAGHRHRQYAATDTLTRLIRLEAEQVNSSLIGPCCRRPTSMSSI